MAERYAQCSIVRVTGVARMTVAKLAKKSAVSPPPVAPAAAKKTQRRRWEALELDEMWAFVGRKRRKVWLWLAVERASRRIVVWDLGRRDAATARRLWQALPNRYRRHCWYFTDLFPAYAQAFSAGSHRPCPKGEGQTTTVEALNCSLRQRCGVLVRKSCSFSKSLPVHAAQVKICIDQHNHRIMRRYITAYKFIILTFERLYAGGHRQCGCGGESLPTRNRSEPSYLPQLGG